MKIDDYTYNEYTLASVDERSDTFRFDFALSSGLAGCSAYFFMEDMNVAIAIILVIKFLYYLLPEYFFGKTFGKMITHTKMVSADASKPSMGRLLIRTTLRALTFVNFVSDDRFAIHDRYSNTIVVKDNYRFELKKAYVKWGYGSGYAAFVVAVWATNLNGGDYVPYVVALTLIVLSFLTFYMTSKLRRHA